MSANVPHLRFRPTPFMAGQIHQIALREGRSQASVLNTLILEAIYARLSPLSDIARAVAHVHAHGRKSEQVTA